jgi:tripartite-type tricarboxylate transporter receptor subunit TctC
MRLFRKASLILVSAAIAASAFSARAADFYKNRVLTLVISSSGGGGYDTLGRLVAKHLPDHLPVSSGLVVQNMPGAGGIVATNYLFNLAPKDGTTIGLVQNNTPFEPLMGTKQAKYDPSKFNWLGSPSSETGILAVWHTVPVDTIAKAEQTTITVGSSGAQSTPSFYARLLNATLGTKLKIVVGYPGQAEAFLAMQRGEVDGYPSIFYSSLMATHPDWVKDGLLKLLVQFGDRKQPALPNIPFAPDLVKTPEDKLLLQAGFAGVSVGRPFLAPPGVPDERVSELRTALAATFADPKFLAEADKMNLGINEARSGEELARVIAETYQTPKSTVEKLRTFYSAQ